MGQVSYVIMWSDDMDRAYRAGRNLSHSSITSSGQLSPLGPRPYFVLIEGALRDEGTSYHYLPPSDYATADPELYERAYHAVAATERSGWPVISAGMGNPSNSNTVGAMSAKRPPFRSWQSSKPGSTTIRGTS